MKDRCLNPTDPAYHKYGGRGITICDRWINSFETFLADMGHRPAPGLTIDRIDNDGPYSPENCRWATRKEQGRNQRTNVLHEFRGRMITIAEVAEITDRPYRLVWRRITELGWDIERAVSAPSDRSQRYRTFQSEERP